MMKIELMQDDEGRITVTMDGEEPMLFDTAEEACEMIEDALGVTESEEPPMEDMSEQAQVKKAMAAEGEEDFAAGFKGVRGTGM